jgi:hypothetical protein
VIDGHIHQPWPDEVLAALAHLKQGNVVQQPPFFYAATPRYGIWQLTKSAGALGEDPDLLELPPEDGSPYGLITTQTCDLCEQSPKPKQPWIKIAPVYQMGGTLAPDQQKQVANHEIGHLVLLTGRALPSGFWVADLRIEFPVEKSWLVGRHALDGFDSEADYLKLAERLARRYDRPALHNAISEEIVGRLRGHFKAKSKSKRTALLSQVEELRLEIRGARLQPRAARLLVITKTSPVPSSVQTWFDNWWQGATKACASRHLALLGNKYATLTELNAADYKAAVPLDFAYLSPDD